MIFHPSNHNNFISRKVTIIIQLKVELPYFTWAFQPAYPCKTPIAPFVCVSHELLDKSLRFLSSKSFHERMNGLVVLLVPLSENEWYGPHPLILILLVLISQNGWSPRLLLSENEWNGPPLVLSENECNGPPLLLPSQRVNVMVLLLPRSENAWNGPPPPPPPCSCSSQRMNDMGILPPLPLRE